jgi:hypothetical protein
MPVFYQPVDQLYCVRAVYKPIDPAKLSAGIAVLNTAREGSVTGRTRGSSGGTRGLDSIVALPGGGDGPTAASKLSVGPGFLAGLARTGLGCGAARGRGSQGAAPRAALKPLLPPSRVPPPFSHLSQRLSQVQVERVRPVLGRRLCPRLLLGDYLGGPAQGGAARRLQRGAPERAVLPRHQRVG